MADVAGWRYRCPNGHVTVVRRRDDPEHGRDPKAEFYCRTCKDNPRLDPHHHHIVDAKTGDYLPRGTTTAAD